MILQPHAQHNKNRAILDGQTSSCQRDLSKLIVDNCGFRGNLDRVMFGPSLYNRNGKTRQGAWGANIDLIPMFATECRPSIQLGPRWYRDDSGAVDGISSKHDGRNRLGRHDGRMAKDARLDVGAGRNPRFRAVVALVWHICWDHRVGWSNLALRVYRELMDVSTRPAVKKALQAWMFICLDPF